MQAEFSDFVGTDLLEFELLNTIALIPNEFNINEVNLTDVAVVVFQKDEG